MDRSKPYHLRYFFRRSTPSTGFHLQWQYRWLSGDLYRWWLQYWYRWFYGQENRKPQEENTLTDITLFWKYSIPLEISSRKRKFACSMWALKWQYMITRDIFRSWKIRQKFACLTLLNRRWFLIIMRIFELRTDMADQSTSLIWKKLFDTHLALFLFVSLIVLLLKQKRK